MSSLTQGIINQKIQDTVDDKNNSWLQSYERNIFFVCVRWTSGTETAAAVFGSWQTAGTADISFILKEKKNMFPLTIIKAQHELFTLEEQCNISCIESWLCWLLYINYKVICSLSLSCCYLRNQSCGTHDDVQYLIYETWNQRQKTVKPLFQAEEDTESVLSVQSSFSHRELPAAVRSSLRLGVNPILWAMFK